MSNDDAANSAARLCSSHPPLPTVPEIEAALETLTTMIWCYGPRLDKPFSITWGNGITAGISGRFEAGGLPNVAKRICQLEGDDRRTLRHNQHGYTLNTNDQPLCKCGATTNRAYRDVPNLPCWSCGRSLSRVV